MSLYCHLQVLFCSADKEECVNVISYQYSTLSLITSKMPDSKCILKDHLPVTASNEYPVLFCPSNTVMTVKLYFVPGVSEETSCVTDASS